MFSAWSWCRELIGMGVWILRSRCAAMSVPGSFASKASKKPPSRYGLIQYLSNDSLCLLLVIRHVGQVRREIRHSNTTRSGGCFREEAERFAFLGDGNGLALSQFRGQLAEGFLELTSVHFFHVRHDVRH